MKTFVDIHVLQTVPPSNINRDDTGSPKVALYGGVNRARVSSQAWKRATRTAFGEHFDRSDLGVRTKRVVELLEEEIKRQQPATTNARILAEKTFAAAGIAITVPKAKKGDQPGPGEAGYLLFLSRHQVSRLAELALLAAAQGKDPTKNEARAAADREHSVDVALFGRMVADASELNVDASAQVAHALSVHGVDNEFDYFTAVDDRKAEVDESGAGMIGTVEFNSSTLYRYATVNVDGLLDTLGDQPATRRAVTEFVRAFVTSMPTGKQNTFANRTLPDAVVVQVRSEQPVNLVGAFEEAIVAREGESRLSQAAQRLADHADRIDRAFGFTPSSTYVVAAAQGTEVLARLGKPVSFTELLNELEATVQGRMEQQ